MSYAAMYRTDNFATSSSEIIIIKIPPARGWFDNSAGHYVTRSIVELHGE